MQEPKERVKRKGISREGSI